MESNLNYADALGGGRQYDKALSGEGSQGPADDIIAHYEALSRSEFEMTS